ncbi:MAG TPA: glycosyltransferase family 4 protein, partial [Candidatus Peribacterales bacterium]|nr:glycosyltransferase family 4 protein [Candidatus Peribacterales bacterium]
ILFTRFPLESHFGGAEVQTLNLMKGLMEKGREVSFLGSCPTLLEAISNERLAINMKKMEIGPPPVTQWNAISFLWRKRKMKQKLINVLESELAANRLPLTAIFMLSLTEKLLLTEWCHKRGMKVIWIEHDRIGRWLTKNPWLPLLRRMSQYATTVVVSKMSIDLYQKMGWRGEIIAIPNGVDIDKFCGTPILGVQHVAERRATFHIGCIARLTRDKGVDLLIEAVKDIPNVHLTIIGSGREETNVRSLLKKNLPATHSTSSGSSTSYQLQATHPNIADFYRSIDLLILPSREHDPFGLVIAEAMAAGVPTICTDACGIAAHLDPSESIIVKAGKSENLRDAILKIQQHDTYAHLAAVGPEIAKNRFSLRAMVASYDALLY